MQIIAQGKQKKALNFYDKKKHKRIQYHEFYAALHFIAESKRTIKRFL